MTRNLPSTPNQVEIRKRQGFSQKLRPRGNLICLAAVFCKTNLSNNKNKGLKRFTFHGGALSDVILFPWKEEIICQQKAAREKKKQLFRQAESEQMMMREFSVHSAAVHETQQLQRSQL